MSTAALTTVLAKFTGLSAAAKAGVGLTVAAGAVGAAAGTPLVVDELTDPPQVQVAPAATDSPSATPTTPAPEGTESATPAPTDVPGEDPTTSWQDAETFGAWVSQDARDGGVDGQEISQAARERAELRRSTDQETTTPVEPGEGDGADDSATEPTTEPATEPGEQSTAPDATQEPAEDGASRGADAPGRDR